MPVKVKPQPGVMCIRANRARRAIRGRAESWRRLDPDVNSWIAHVNGLSATVEQESPGYAINILFIDNPPPWFTRKILL